MPEAGCKIEYIKTPFKKKILIVSQEPIFSELKKIITVIEKNNKFSTLT